MFVFLPGTQRIYFTCDAQVMIERQSRHHEGREGELVLQEEGSEPLVWIFFIVVIVDGDGDCERASWSY